MKELNINRLNNENNQKFNIIITVNERGRKEEISTFIQDMIQYVGDKNNNKKKLVNKFKQFLQLQEYDSDANYQSN